MKSSELTGKTASELDSLLLELSREQFNLRIQQGIGQLSAPHRMKSVRRDIARVKTILNQKAAQ